MLHGTKCYMVQQDTWYYRLLGTTGYLVLQVSWYYRLIGTTGYLVLQSNWYYKLLGTTCYMVLQATWYYRLLGTTCYLLNIQVEKIKFHLWNKCSTCYVVVTVTLTNCFRNRTFGLIFFQIYYLVISCNLIITK